MKFKRKFKGVGDVFAIFAILSLVLSIVQMTVFKYSMAVTLESDIQTDLILSNTAVYKYVDLKSIGDDNPRVIIKDHEGAYNEMLKHLKVNMSLDDNLRPRVEGSLKGPIKVKDFTIYNFYGDIVEIITCDDGKFNKEVKNSKTDSIVTRNGYTVKSTMVTTTIQFNYENMFGRVQPLSISVDTDMVNMEERE